MCGSRSTQTSLSETIQRDERIGIEGDGKIERIEVSAVDGSTVQITDSGAIELAGDAVDAVTAGATSAIGKITGFSERTIKSAFERAESDAAQITKGLTSTVGFVLVAGFLALVLLSRRGRA